MTVFENLQRRYGQDGFGNITISDLERLPNDFKQVSPSDITSAKDGQIYIALLRDFRKTVAKVGKLQGDRYPQLIKSLLSVGEDGLYSNSLRFIFELIQNVDDCDYHDTTDCKLDMRFDFENDEIILKYNEVGFTPYNVFAITGIAESCKNISSAKKQIGEKGIGFKSVFGVADRVWIRSGWFSFELHKEDFTVPIPMYDTFNYCQGTQMVLHVPDRAKKIYTEIKEQYCKGDSLFSRNPLLFLNKLTSLKFYFDDFRSMEFNVSRTKEDNPEKFKTERDVEISVDLRDYENGSEVNVKKEIRCTRYTYYVVFSKEACRTRYGKDTQVGQQNGKAMVLSAVIPNAESIEEVGNGALYSFLPTQLRLTVPIVCHVPFKLDASREFVDPQNSNLWFQEASEYLSQLMDRAYLDYCHTAKESIVRYLPDRCASLFAVNNGKETCLTEQRVFNGSHYLGLPIFYTVDGNFKTSDEVFCFSESEDIEDPEIVYLLMDYRKSLIIPPIPVRRFGIATERNVKDKLFQKALSSADKTSKILDYLDSVKYEYSEQTINKLEPIKVSQAQLGVIVQHRLLFKKLQIVCCDSIRNGKRFNLTVTHGKGQTISETFGNEFELSDAPKRVEEYMASCQNRCICVDTLYNNYLPCYDAILISAKKTLSSFVAFCQEIDPNDPFTIRVKLRETSEELNRYMDDLTIPESEYMRRLRQIRLNIRDALGRVGYQSYIDTILKAGTNGGRFIQELLQNADDCLYLQDVTPTFSLSLENNTITTEYNEAGFTRANIRSITAIGESTKNSILSKEYHIGEKGVGFKTIFAIASKVTIHSGNYYFYLKDREPTIPRLDLPALESVSGTRMEIVLKGNKSLPIYMDRELLELCLCLRRLKRLSIRGTEITINDTDDTRTVRIGKRNYIFKKFTHKFRITDRLALGERKHDNRRVSVEQQVVCYVPISNNAKLEFPLYCGLPTKHTIKIPLAIDAPFSLTTSREEIETYGSKWNDIIRKEVYKALLTVVDSLKFDERAKVFRFLRFIPKRNGLSTVYVNGTFESDYLNYFHEESVYDFLGRLKEFAILPTYDKNIFAVPLENRAYRFPKPITYVIDSLSKPNYLGIDVSTIIDTGDYDCESVLNALGCNFADCSKVLPILLRHAESFIINENFRKDLYEYLTIIPEDYREMVKRLKIIPVYGVGNSSTMYIAWKDDSIFIKSNAKQSEANYYVLNETFMTKNTYEAIYGNINEMSREWEHHRYNDRLREILCSEQDISIIYNFLLKEYISGRLLKNNSFEVLRGSGNRIPLKNQCGKITSDNLFICNKSGYFTTEMIMSMSVHNECKGLAKEIGIKQLSEIHYEDIHYTEPLTEDDVETLIDEPNHYFTNYEEILRGFYNDGSLSDELLQDYHLEYISVSGANSSANDDDYEFPYSPVSSIRSIQNHVKKLLKNPSKIISVVEKRTVRKVQPDTGKPFTLDSEEARESVLNIYTPESKPTLCFCQMCCRVKSKQYIKVNSIELLPEYYFSQLRVALCLECSKHFELLRNNRSIRRDYIKRIKTYPIGDKGTIEIPICEDVTLTFTATHLAEVQEILKQRPNSLK